MADMRLKPHIKRQSSVECEYCGLHECRPEGFTRREAEESHRIHVATECENAPNTILLMREGLL